MLKNRRHITTVAEFLAELGSSNVTYAGEILKSLLKHSKISIDKDKTYITNDVKMFAGTNLGYTLFNENSILVLNILDWEVVNQYRFDTHKLVVGGIIEPVTDPLIAIERNMRMYIDSFTDRDDIVLSQKWSCPVESPRMFGTIVLTKTNSTELLLKSPNACFCKHVSVVGKNNRMDIIDIINTYLSDNETNHGIVDSVSRCNVRYKYDPHVNFMRYVIKENVNSLGTIFTKEQEVVLDKITKASISNDGTRRVIVITGEPSCGKTTLAFGAMCDISKESNHPCRYITHSNEVRNRMYNMSVAGHCINKTGVYEGMPFFDIVNGFIKVADGLAFQAVFVDDAQNASKYARDRYNACSNDSLIEDLFEHTNTVVAIFSDNCKTTISDCLTKQYLQQYCSLYNAIYTEYNLNSLQSGLETELRLFDETIRIAESVTIADDYKCLDGYVKLIGEDKAKTQLLSLTSIDNEWISACYNGSQEDKDNKFVSDFNAFFIHGLKSGKEMPMPLRWAPQCGNVTHKKFMEEHRDGDGMIPYYIPDDGVLPDKYSFTVLPEHYKYVANAKTVCGLHFKNTVVLIPRIVYYDEREHEVKIDINLCDTSAPVFSQIPKCEIVERIEAYVKNQLIILLTRATTNMQIMVEDGALREFLKEQINNGQEG